MAKKKSEKKQSKKKSDGVRGERRRGERRRAAQPPPPQPTDRDARAAARAARPVQPVRRRRQQQQAEPVPVRRNLPPPPEQEEEENEEPYIYCGNNAMHPDLVNGTARAGTRLECLRRGFGSGFHSAVDLSFLQPYEAIDARKKYCGNREILPDGYDMFGNAPTCFQKGWATGKRQRAMQAAAEVADS